MPVIRKFLDLSTAHLTEASRAYLDDASIPEEWCTIGPPTAKHTYGWWMHASEDPCEDLPEDLLAITTYARSLDCDYVHFDADADIDTALPVYETADGRSLPPLSNGFVP